MGLEEGAVREQGCSKAFRTGDIGVITPEGLKILGRLDLQVKIGGTAPTHLDDDLAILADEWALVCALRKTIKRLVLN